MTIEDLKTTLATLDEMETKAAKKYRIRDAQKLAAAMALVLAEIESAKFSTLSISKP